MGIIGRSTNMGSSYYYNAPKNMAVKTNSIKYNVLAM